MTGAAQLEVVAGRAAGTTILVEDELLIGRLANGSGQLGDDDEISRRHARVTMDRSGFCAIEDLGSTNGTFVNGLRIAVPVTLAPGDTIELGTTTLVVRGLPAAEPEPRTALTDASREPAEPAALPTLSFQVDVDFVAGTAQLSLKDTPEPLRFVLDQGTWRSHPPTQKGGPR